MILNWSGNGNKNFEVRKMKKVQLVDNLVEDWRLTVELHSRKMMTHVLVEDNLLEVEQHNVKLWVVDDR